MNSRTRRSFSGSAIASWSDAMPSSRWKRSATAGVDGMAQTAARTVNIDALEPVIQPTTWSRSVAGGGHVGDLLAAVEDDDPVGHLVAEREVVGDDDDRDALVGHPPDQRLDVLGLLVAERRGRLVEQQDALRLAVDADRAAGQGHDLALAAGEHLDRPGHRRGADAEPVQLRLGAAPHRLAVDEAQPAERPAAQLLLAHVEVGRDVLRLHEGEVLVDHLDARLGGTPTEPVGWQGRIARIHLDTRLGHTWSQLPCRISSSHVDGFGCLGRWVVSTHDQYNWVVVVRRRQAKQD